MKELAEEDMTEGCPHMHSLLLISLKKLGRWPPGNRLSWSLLPIHVRTILILVLVLRIIILVTVLLKCMSNLLWQLVFYVILYTLVKASTHFVMLDQCCHRAFLFVLYYSVCVSLSGLFICLLLAGILCLFNKFEAPV